VGGCTGLAGTVSVTINTIPSAPVAGSNSPLCEGDNLNLTATTISGGTYTWTGPNSYSSSTQNPTINAVTSAEAGTYSVYATVNGCNSALATTSVVINPVPAAPTAGSNSPVCEGDTLLLTASTVTSATYDWIGPNSFTSSSQNPEINGITAAGAGTYSVAAIVSGCTSPLATVSVVVNAIPSSPVATAQCVKEIRLNYFLQQ
jgi:large repetitive protein